jgi:CRISP-associated protein Cas1
MLDVIHSDHEDAPAFVFNMVEPERPKVDKAMLAFLKLEALHPADFTIREDGVVRLNPELARQVVDWSFDWVFRPSNYVAKVYLN